MESFWGILKQELVHHRHNHTLQEAMAEIAEYIEIFYSKPEGQSTTCLQVGECKGLGYSLFFK
jgi:hypothetical protein